MEDADFDGLYNWGRTFLEKGDHETAGQCFAARDALPEGTIPAVPRRLDEVLLDRPPALDW